MALIVLARRVQEDFDRILGHLQQTDPESANARVQDIVSAICVLSRSPAIGRPASEGRRELVIGRGGRGYVALYRYEADRDIVLILAIRAQREAGFRH